MTWAPQADPQTAEEARRSPRYPEVVVAATGRGITSIVHFTRTIGLKGIMSTSVVKARRYLPQDARVKYVYQENASDRSRDLPWHGYVNLSITGINTHMFRRSKKWHPGEEWVVLEFGPEILGDPGVVFCTTNNAYEEVVQRSAGPQGFEQMFAPRVPWGYFGSVGDRSNRTRNQTTDPQAEVLYPSELSLENLHTITVADEDTYETAKAILSHFPHDAKVSITPEAFQ